MSRISSHSKMRSIERVAGVKTVAEAKRFAKQARLLGKTINYYQNCPKFFSYLQNKRNQTRSCSIRIYKDNIYIWRGKKNPTLITVHPIPDRYKQEIVEAQTV